MSARGHIDSLQKLLTEHFPGSTVKVDAPARSSGDWFIDFSTGGRDFVIQYRPKLGFGVSSSEPDAFGEGPHEYFPDELALVDRIANLLKNRARTVPQRFRILQELRRARDVSQGQLVETLGIKQPAISKYERERDLVSRFAARYVAALGGTLRVIVEFEDEDESFELEIQRDSVPPKSA